MVAPEVPGGGAVGQAVLSYQAHSQVLDTFGVLALGHGQVGHVSGETQVAVGALVLGVGNDQVDGPASQHVSQVMQGASAEAAAWGAFAAPWAVPARVVPTAPHHLGLGQIFNVADAFRDVAADIPLDQSWLTS